MPTIKTAIVLWFFLAGTLAHAQQPSNPPPILPCGTGSLGDDLPCLKDGKIVVRRSGNYVPYIPLSPEAAAALAAPEKGATVTEPPTTTVPKPTFPQVRPYKVNESPSTTPVADLQDEDAIVPPTKQAPATNSPNNCHDFWSCFSQGYSQAAADRAAIATGEQQNRRLAAENQQKERRFAEQMFNDMEKVRQMIAGDTATSTPNYSPMVKEAIQQEKDSWSNIRKIYCERAPRANYINLDGKPQSCTQP